MDILEILNQITNQHQTHHYFQSWSYLNLNLISKTILRQNVKSLDDMLALNVPAIKNYFYQAFGRYFYIYNIEKFENWYDELIIGIQEDSSIERLLNEIDNYLFQIYELSEEDISLIKIKTQ